MRGPPSDGASRSYGRRVNEYIDSLGSIDVLEASTRATSLDRDLIGTWVRQQPNGQVLDVGCGPGRWTHWPHERGIDTAGADPAPEFVRRPGQLPDISFSAGRAEQRNDSGSTAHEESPRTRDLSAVSGVSLLVADEMPAR